MFLNLPLSIVSSLESFVDAMIAGSLSTKESGGFPEKSHPMQQHNQSKQPQQLSRKELNASLRVAKSPTLGTAGLPKFNAIAKELASRRKCLGDLKLIDSKPDWRMHRSA